MKATTLPLPLLLLLFALPLRAFADTPDPALLEAGRAIFERGLLPSGEPLHGQRAGGVEVSGAPAACMQCHRRSGIGTTEGSSPVPSITAPALFAPARPLGHQPRTPAGVQVNKLPYHARPPYTDATLARALREGVAPDGRAFGFLMPRYALADADLAALTAYLRTLGATPSPGADNRLAHFATVIAPDTDPARRRQMVEVLNACFREQYPERFTDPTGRVKPGERLGWRLHVWQLDGTPDSWEAQLAARYAQQPVFALVSGLAGETWLPVHRFCEAGRVPCLFPNTDAPGESDDSVYNFYLYRGVMLEADAIAQHLESQREPLGIQRVLQVARRETAGQDGADRLTQVLTGKPLQVTTQLLDDGPPALDALNRDDALVLWLREPDLKAMVQLSPALPAASRVIVSGTLGGADRAPLPPAWKQEVRIAYPFDPPGRWDNRMIYNLRPWLAKHRLARGDERLQGNTLTACNFLVTGIARLQGRWQRDLLLENVEIGLEGNQAAPSAFPRFSLGPNQRFGSKGAFIVKFESPLADRIERDSDWIVP